MTSVILNLLIFYSIQLATKRLIVTITTGKLKKLLHNVDTIFYMRLFACPNPNLYTKITILILGLREY